MALDLQILQSMHPKRALAEAVPNVIVRGMPTRQETLPAIPAGPSGRSHRSTKQHVQTGRTREKLAEVAAAADCLV
jgi:hypothetical protein